MYKDFFLQMLLLEQYTQQSEQNIKCDIEVRVDVKTVHAVKTFLGDLNRHPGKTQIVRLDSILDLKTQLPRKTP